MHRRKYKRRRTKTVIIEYEVEERGKFPVTKTVRKRVNKKKVGLSLSFTNAAVKASNDRGGQLQRKRQPHTAARRSHVRAAVRARLAERQEPRAAHAPLQARRRAAGIPALSLRGDPNALDYFAEEERAEEEAGVTVAARPAASVFSAFRQVIRHFAAFEADLQFFNFV